MKFPLNYTAMKQLNSTNGGAEIFSIEFIQAYFNQEWPTVFSWEVADVLPSKIEFQVEFVPLQPVSSADIDEVKFTILDPKKFSTMYGTPLDTGKIEANYTMPLLKIRRQIRND